MKFTLSWLHDHLETDASIEKICKTLNDIGLEVENVEDAGSLLAPFKTARIIVAEQHPNADRLRVCSVDVGEANPVQVVCGAPNARAGLNVIFAPPGTYIPGSDITIKEGEIRGEKSGGMLCSYEELDQGQEGEGIAELPEGTLPGQSYVEFAGLNDPVIEIAITPNRGDALGVRGIARDLAAAGLGNLKPWLVETKEGDYPSPLSWSIEYPQACPWIMGRVIKNVKNNPSPQWLQNRLKAIGLRPISALVDITNFFAFDLGRPLHVFDLDKLKGNVLHVCPGSGERFDALDGKEYTVTVEDCIIVDKAGIQSLAGIMGAQHSAVDEATTNIFVECALFDAVKIALTGRRLSIFSDARYRFERMVDPALLPMALDAATGMIIELCGGEPSQVTSAGAQPHWQREAALRFREVKNFGGLDVSPEESKNILHRLGFTLTRENEDEATFSVPSWRNDICMPFALDQQERANEASMKRAAEGALAVEAEHDLIEEILRIKGLEHVPTLSLPQSALVPETAFSPLQRRSAIARRVLAAQGLMECVGYSFASQEMVSRFGEISEHLQLLNPIAADMDQLRTTPLVTLFTAAQKNIARGYSNLGLFEIGAAFKDNQQNLVAAGILTGYSPRHRGGGHKPCDVWQAKALVQTVLETFNIVPDSLTVTADAPSYYHPGQSGVFRLGPKNILAFFGVIHPKILREKGIEEPMVAFELLLDALPQSKSKKNGIAPLSPFQPVRRDFAFVVRKDVQAQALLKAIKGADRTLITEVSLFDVYEGDKIPEGHKSLAIEVVLQPMTKSLTDTELENISTKIIAAAEKSVAAVLR